MLKGRQMRLRRDKKALFSFNLYYPDCTVGPGFSPGRESEKPILSRLDAF